MVNCICHSYCPLSSTNSSFICLQIVLVFTPLNYLLSSTTVVILLFTLDKHAGEHRLERSSTQLPSGTYQPLSSHQLFLGGLSLCPKTHWCLFFLRDLTEWLWGFWKDLQHDRAVTFPSQTFDFSLCITVICAITASVLRSYRCALHRYWANIIIKLADFS